MREIRSYLGLELAGAKNQKTAAALLEFYPKEGKLFLLDVYERITPSSEEKTADEALLELIDELNTDIQAGLHRIGVNVPLELPPCMACVRKTCPMPGKCTVPAIKWMREITRKAAKAGLKTLEFTPYTQRPVELWIRYQVLPRLPESHRIEVDETLGGNKAPLTARMNFLKRQLRDMELVEVSPKLTVAILCTQLGLPKRVVETYRRLEEGAHARETILETLAEKRGVFVYERDIRKLSQSLTAFDAFICAYTALLSDIEQSTKAPSGFPAATGWTAYPKLDAKS